MKICIWHYHINGKSSSIYLFFSSQMKNSWSIYRLKNFSYLQNKFIYFFYIYLHLKKLKKISQNPPVSAQNNKFILTNVHNFEEFLYQLILSPKFKLPNHTLLTLIHLSKTSLSFHIIKFPSKKKVFLHILNIATK